MGRKRIKPEITTNNVDKLCNLVNEKYNLKPNSIGSIEYHSDMCESAIVYGNRYRDDIDKELTRGEELFYQGDYKLALNTVVNAINSVEEGFANKINQYRSE